jgi:hypothetical protein
LLKSRIGRMEMADKRVKAWSVLGLKNTGDGSGVCGICPQTVNGFRAERDKLSRPQKAGGGFKAGGSSGKALCHAVLSNIWSRTSLGF